MGKVFFISLPCTRTRLARDDASLALSTNTPNTPISQHMQKRAVKRAVSLCKLMLVFCLLIFTSCFAVDQSHAQLFVEFNIRACDKLTFFSNYARAYWRVSSYALDSSGNGIGVGTTSFVCYQLAYFLGDEHTRVCF